MKQFTIDIEGGFILNQDGMRVGLLRIDKETLVWNATFLDDRFKQSGTVVLDMRGVEPVEFASLPPAERPA